MTCFRLKGPSSQLGNITSKHTRVKIVSETFIMQEHIQYASSQDA